jgi:hypothetical protein
MKPARQGQRAIRSIPPRTLAAIIDGTGRHDVTVTALAQAVPYQWDRKLAGQVSEQTRGGARQTGAPSQTRAQAVVAGDVDVARSVAARAK